MGDPATLPMSPANNPMGPISPSGTAGFFSNPLALLALAGIGGGIGGAIPSTSTTNTSGSGSSSSTSSQQGTTNTGFDLTSFINLLNNLKSSSTGTSNTQNVGSQTQVVTPTMDPATQAMLTRLIGASSSLTVPSLTGYENQQTSNINNASDLQSQAVNNIMASRGLSTSPVAGTAQAGIAQNRINQITGMQQQLPLLRNQLNLQNLAGATSLFSAIPKGSTSTGVTTGGSSTSTTGDTTQTQTGSQTGGQSGTGVTSSNQTGSQNTNTSNTGSGTTTAGGGLGTAARGAVSGMMSVLPFLLMGMSDKKLKKDITDIPQAKAIAKIRELKGKEWTWKGGETKDSGIIAQELERVLPELVHTTKVGDKELKAVNYSGIIPYLIGSIQELDSRLSSKEAVTNA